MNNEHLMKLLTTSYLIAMRIVDIFTQNKIIMIYSFYIYIYIYFIFFASIFITASEVQHIKMLM
jgi:hypothetical protein